MSGQTRIDGNLIDTGTDPNDILSVESGDGRYPQLSGNNTLTGNLTLDGGEIAVDTIKNAAGTGGPTLPNGIAGGLTLGGDLTLDTNGIYLGGTGSANYLDDYEEGTWTPTLQNGSNYGELEFAQYTKIGRIVHIVFRVDSFTDSSSADSIVFEGLPFQTKNGTRSNGSIEARFLTAGSSDIQVCPRIVSNLVSIRKFSTNTSSNWDTLKHSDISSSSRMIISITYETDS